MSDETTQIVEYSLSQRDFTRYTDFVFARNTKRWRFALLRRIGLVLFALFGAISVWTRWLRGDPFFSAGDLPLVAVVAYLLLFPNFMRWISGRNFRSAGFERIRAPQRIEISPSGIRAHTGIADSMTPWSSIIDVETTPDGLYLFVLRNSAHIVPRHGFADDTAFDAFSQAAMRYWKAGA